MNDEQAFEALTQAELLEMTTEIVSAYVGHNATHPQSLPALIEQVHGALAGLAGVTGRAGEAERPPTRRADRTIGDG